MLMEVLKDDFYEFDKGFIFEYISGKLNYKGPGLGIDEQFVKKLFTNIIENDLYDKKLLKLLAYLVGSFQFYDIFM